MNERMNCLFHANILMDNLFNLEIHFNFSSFLNVLSIIFFICWSVSLSLGHSYTWLG